MRTILVLVRNNKYYNKNENREWVENSKYSNKERFEIVII